MRSWWLSTDAGLFFLSFSESRKLRFIVFRKFDAWLWNSKPLNVFPWMWSSMGAISKKKSTSTHETAQSLFLVGTPSGQNGCRQGDNSHAIGQFGHARQGDSGSCHPGWSRKCFVEHIPTSAVTLDTSEPRTISPSTWPSHVMLPHKARAITKGLCSRRVE